MEITQLGSLQREQKIQKQRSELHEKTAEIEKVSEEFASIFMELVVDAMRSTVPESGLIDGGNAEEIYRSLLDSEYSKQLVTGPGKKLAEDLKKQLLARQGGTQYGLRET
ncbi:MAG: rod-binding protein [Oligoflexales bacterium]